MNEQSTAVDWDPCSQPVLEDQIKAYDELRGRCPVARSEALHWSLFKHADVLRVLHDHRTFSSQVSSHPSASRATGPSAKW